MLLTTRTAIFPAPLNTSGHIPYGDLIDRGTSNLPVRGRCRPSEVSPSCQLKGAWVDMETNVPIIFPTPRTDLATGLQHVAEARVRVGDGGHPGPPSRAQVQLDGHGIEHQTTKRPARAKVARRSNPLDQRHVGRGDQRRRQRQQRPRTFKVRKGKIMDLFSRHGNWDCFSASSSSPSIYPTCWTAEAVATTMSRFTRSTRPSPSTSEETGN